MNQVPIFVDKVLVTTQRSPRALKKLAARLKPDAIQLHRVSASELRSLRKVLVDGNIIASVHYAMKRPIRTALRMSGYVDAILADSYHPSKAGGSGMAGDWTLARQIRDGIFPKPLILAGGLTANNVLKAIRVVRPYGVDVSSGVESRQGVKDPGLISEFIRTVRESMT